jgi:hypothetical protein
MKALRPKTKVDVEATEREIRALRTVAVVLSAIFLFVGIPIAGNWDKSGVPIVEPRGAWGTFLTVAGLAAMMCGVVAVVIAIHVDRLSDQLPGRRRSRRREGRPPT